MRHKSAVVRHKNRGVGDKMFIKKSVECVQKKRDETQSPTPIINQLVTYYNTTEQNITLLQNNVDICWTKVVHVATKI